MSLVIIPTTKVTQVTKTKIVIHGENLYQNVVGHVTVKDETSMGTTGVRNDSPWPQGKLPRFYSRTLVLVTQWEKRDSVW